MDPALDALARIRDLSQEDFEVFRAALRTLTSKTFIIRGIEKEQELYHFTVRNAALFEAWFACMDASIVRDEGLGVIAFQGPGSARLHFTREEICAVLALRLLYEDKKLEVFLTAFPVVTVMDFQQKYNAMTGEEIKKTALINVLRKLSSGKLIGLDSQDYADPEGLIQLYPSIALSLSRDALDAALAFLRDRNASGGSAPAEDDGEAS
ncbi:MAG: DUF4194 domain-containing protein [Spirochaetaceae bacterium]|jgi:hypothetical protein|nr:DUF4194 domain-containing protein [Spirochaetaceae bacterium]